MTSYHFQTEYSTQWNVTAEPSPTVLAHQWAEHQFDEVFYAAKRSNNWAWLWGGNEKLMLLKDEATVEKTAVSKRQTVAVAEVKGSVEESLAEFDANFRPTSQQSRTTWVSVAAAVRLCRPLPPVELLKVGNRYFVIDGLYRLSVAKWLGKETIEANVTEATAFRLHGEESGYFLDDEWAVYISTYGFAYF